MSDMLSQDEINALLGNNIVEGYELTDEKKDILGEVGNISMGTAATTLFALLNHKVEISTPTVSMIKPDSLVEKYDKPCVGLKINYKEGLIGTNVLILKQHDVKVIVSLMMGGDGTVENEDEPLNEIELSAISEAMNQMVGSSSTSLSSMLGYKIDIDTPQAFVLKFEDDDFFKDLDINNGEDLVSNSFRMVVGDLIDSEVMQLFPIEFAENIIETLKTSKEEVPQQQAPQQQIPQQQAPQQQIPQQQAPQTVFNNVDVQPAQFQGFDINELNQQKENITIIRDVPLEVTVELGRTKKPIREILEFSPGTIIELDKLAGEPIDILVNGKFIAKGEVVVIDENFGVRITNIISVEERI